MDSHSHARRINGSELWLQGIEGQALPKLIMSDSRVVRVVAGPGSGKTFASELANSLGVSTTTDGISEEGGTTRNQIRIDRGSVWKQADTK